MSREVQMIAGEPQRGSGGVVAPLEVQISKNWPPEPPSDQQP